MESGIDYNGIYRMTHFREFKATNELERFSESIKQHLNENLVVATIDEFNQQLDTYSDLKELFNSPACKLDPLYRNLVSTKHYEANLNETLKPMITYLLDKPEWKCYFSLSDGKIVGFIAYRIDNSTYSYVDDIKMFSTDLKHTFMLMRDLEKLLEDLRGKYKSIHWSAFKRNIPGNKLYQKAIKKFKGICLEIKCENDTRLDYLIPGTQPLLDEMKVKAVLDFSD